MQAAAQWKLIGCFFFGSHFCYPGIGMSHEVKKSDAILAYTLPFILYVVPTLFENSNGLGLSYEFVCTLKGVLAAIAIGLYRRVYPRLSTNGFGLATIAGVLGFVAWIALHHLQSMIPEIPFVSSWLLAGSRSGRSLDPGSWVVRRHSTEWSTPDSSSTNTCCDWRSDVTWRA